MQLHTTGLERTVLPEDSQRAGRGGRRYSIESSPCVQHQQTTKGSTRKVKNAYSKATGVTETVRRAA